MKKPGIHFRLLLAAIVLITSATLTLDFISVRITRQFMYKRFIDRISFLAKYLAMNSEVGVLIRDKDGLTKLANNLLAEEDVAQVTIFDEKNAPIVDLSKSVSGSLSQVETPVLFKRLRGENLVYTTEPLPMGSVQASVVDQIGKVRIIFSTAGIDELMVEIVRKFLWFSGGLTLIAGLVFFFISRPIVVEVTRLAETARYIGSGDLDLRAKPGHIPETKELAEAFNGMLDSLERNRREFYRINQEMSKHKALAELGKFSMMIAHEVKNPLSIIKSSFDMLKKNLSVPKDNTMAYYIDDEIKRLNRLIEDFLRFARPIKPQFYLTDLNRIIEEIVTRFEIQHDNERLKTVIPETECLSYVDQDLLIRALSNVIKNAIEADEEEGEVKIEVQSDATVWSVKIEDSGEGISHNDLGQIFDPFYTTRSKGTGLGLAYAQQVVQAHEGQIIAENVKGGGARFQVELPIKKGA